MPDKQIYRSQMFPIRPQFDVGQLQKRGFITAQSAVVTQAHQQGSISGQLIGTRGKQSPKPFDLLERDQIGIDLSLTGLDLQIAHGQIGNQTGIAQEHRQIHHEPFALRGFDILRQLIEQFDPVFPSQLVDAIGTEYRQQARRNGHDIIEDGSGFQMRFGYPAVQ